MKIMYIAPRYHTNQVPVVRGLKQKGIEVRFVSQYAGRVEDYSDLTPVVLGYSRLYTVPAAVLGRLRHTDPKIMNDRRMKHGIPPLGAIRRELQNFKPDAVILRERSMYTIAAYRVCRRLHIPGVLYNQSPLYEDTVKNDIPHRIVRSLVPHIRMTPVMGEGRPDQVIEPGSVYVPFVMEQHFDPSDRQWLKDGILHIFTVGKYEKRKNLLMMADVVSRLTAEDRKLSEAAGIKDIHLTIAGECSTDAHRAYFENLQKHIHDIGMESRITLLANLDPGDMPEQYAKADLFVLPSTAEPASISQLEAMSYGLPVICSNKNGTACHVEDGINGYHFRDNDAEDLRRKVLDCMCTVSGRPGTLSGENSPSAKKPAAAESLSSLGAASYRLVGKKYSIGEYLGCLYGAGALPELPGRQE